jgi:hypothetical protein
MFFLGHNGNRSNSTGISLPGGVFVFKVAFIDIFSGGGEFCHAAEKEESVAFC